MFKLNDLLVKIVEKMARDEPLTDFQKILIEQAEKQARQREKLLKKFHLTHQHITNINTGDTKKDGSPSIVPVFRYVGYGYGKKYDGVKLRKLRRDRVKASIKLGTEIPKDRFVDLWKPEDHSDEVKVTRQQLRYMTRQAEKAQRKGQQYA